ncbi:MAG: peptide deformylase [Zetaproteobacteria bacterium]|nr:MAG: peptide deformylase [Zetaproteobacteria bacterium]
MCFEILTYPDPRLRRKSEPVACFDATLADQVALLRRALGDGPGAVGIAAPQLGLARRIVLVDCRRARRPCAHHGALTMINPRIVAGEGEAWGREGCLSVPDWVATVPRATSIEVAFQDERGRSQTLCCKGFEARVVQHEIDHLDGVLFIDRVRSMRDLVRRLPG